MQAEPSFVMPEEQDNLHQLILALEKSNCFDHPVEQFEIVETHISCLLLTGPYVYKFKKPLDLGFLDFTTLEKRKHCCEEEIRLNSRLAPDLYLDVVAITGDERSPQINGDGPVIEYAVKMAQFDRSLELDKLIAQDRVTPTMIDRLAVDIAVFHGQIRTAPHDSRFGTPEHILQPVIDNLAQIKSMLADDRQYSMRMLAIEEWTDRTFEKFRPHFEKRKAKGFIRECHGDMHLGNMVLIDNKPVIFDCIEFSESLHWIDVVSDLAFLVMDLHYYNRPDLAFRLLNIWLQETGDYEGLKGLCFFMAYRALVRAKVACIRLGQEQNREQDMLDYRRHIDLAATFIQSQQPVLFIMHGLSGSGKTTFSQALLERLAAIRIRSDLERKRLHYLPPTAKTGSAIAADLYSPASTDQTYGRLEKLAEQILNAGYPVIVDATFLHASRRQDFRQLAQNCNVPFVILDCKTDDAVLRERIQRRQQSHTDASEADLNVLGYQQSTQQKLRKEEQHYCVTIDTNGIPDIDAVLSAIKNKLEN